MPVGFDALPVFNGVTSWIMLHSDMPLSEDSTAFVLDTLDATSDAGEVTYTLTTIRLSDGNLADPFGFGLEIQDNQVVVTSLLTQQLNKITFPTVVMMRIEDSRSFCSNPVFDEELIGGCYIDVAFNFGVVEFNPTCPDTVTRFTQDEQVAVRWRPPKLFYIGAATDAPLTPTHSIGDTFPIGETEVTYSPILSLNPTVALTQTTAQCTFKVSLCDCLRSMLTICLRCFKSILLCLCGTRT
jgi:hypothetical protein